MIFSRDYIGYLARRTVKHLIDAKLITSSNLKVTEERVNTALLEELSLEEIAKVTRAPLSTVKSRLYRGMAMIKPKLESPAPRSNARLQEAV